MEQSWGIVGEVGGTRTVWEEFQRGVRGPAESAAITDNDWAQIQTHLAHRRAAVLREQTVRGNLGQTGAVHHRARQAKGRLSGQEMRGVMSDILTGLENNVFRPAEEETTGDCQVPRGTVTEETSSRKNPSGFTCTHRTATDHSDQIS